MENEFIKVYKSIDNEKIYFLKKYVLSDFNHKNKYTKDLFQYLFSIKNRNAIVLDRENLYTIIYNDTNYDDLKMRRLFSESKEVLEDFLVYHYALHHKAYYLKGLLEAIKPLDQHSYRKILKRTQSVLETSPYRNEKYYDDRLHLMLSDYEVRDFDNRKNSNSYEDVLQCTINLSAIHHIKNICKYIVQNQSSVPDYVTKYVELTISDIDNPIYAHNTVLHIYVKLYKFLIQQEENDFFSLKELIFQYKDLLEISELHDMFIVLINYAIRQYNTVNVDFGKYALEIYDHGIENGILLQNNFLSRFTYTNYITIALKLQKIAVANRFLSQHKSIISPEYANVTYQYNLARILFAQKDYDKAWQILLSIAPEDIFWDLNAKVLQIKILFETQNEDLTDIYITNYAAYIKRKKNLGYHADYFKKIVKSFQFLLKIYAKSNAQIRNKIEQLQKNNEPDKDWFIYHLEKYL